jgi:hypothetical protein
MSGKCIVPQTSKFGLNIDGPSLGGLTTFEQTISVARTREVALVQIIAAFYNTANLHLESALMEVQWVASGQRFAVAPTVASIEQAPIFEGAVTGRIIIAFPFPLPVPMSPDGSGLRMDCRLLLTRISAACTEWRVFMSWAAKDDRGIWRV